MHEGQDADLASAVRDLEVLVRIGSNELSVAGQERGVRWRAATKQRQLDIQPMLLEDSGIARVVQRHGYGCENGHGDGNLCKLLGFNPKRPRGQCCKCYENPASASRQRLESLLSH